MRSGTRSGRRQEEGSEMKGEDRPAADLRVEQDRSRVEPRTTESAVMNIRAPAKVTQVEAPARWLLSVSVNAPRNTRGTKQTAAASVLVALCEPLGPGDQGPVKEPEGVVRRPQDIRLG